MNNILTIVNNSEHECSNICSRVCFQFLLGIFSNMGFLGPLTILCIIFLGGGTAILLSTVATTFFKF